MKTNIIPCPINEKDLCSDTLGEIGKRDNARLIRNTYGSCKYEDMYNRCYAVINQSYKGWQVLRYFRIDRHGKRDISYSTWEVFQLWNKVGEKQILIARQRAFHYYVDAFLLSSPMEIRQNPKYCASWLHFTDVGFSYMYDKSVDSTYKYCDNLIPTNERKQWYRFLSVDKFAETILKQRIETVEVDLQQMKVVQCYGACDKFTLYHDRIVNLVNNNMATIKQCMTSKQIAI